MNRLQDFKRSIINGTLNIEEVKAYVAEQEALKRYNAMNAKMSKAVERNERLTVVP